jgi:hypothetical protein
MLKDSAVLQPKGKSSGIALRRDVIIIVCEEGRLESEVKPHVLGSRTTITLFGLCRMQRHRVEDSVTSKEGERRLGFCTETSPSRW